MAYTFDYQMVEAVTAYLNGDTPNDDEAETLVALAQRIIADAAAEFAPVCDECGARGCAGVEDCPECGASCHNDQTIPDHGKCYDCHKAWQHGEQPC